MARRISKDQDLLGLVAFGSLITNLAQATDKTRIEVELRQLRSMFVTLRGRYGLVCQEFERMRDLNAELQKVVASQRAEINQLRAVKVDK